MPRKPETIEIDGRRYRKFIHYPTRVNDGTSRCIACGQIDDDPYHDDTLCPMIEAIDATGSVAA